MEQDSKHERKAGSTLTEGKSCSCLSSVTLLFLMELLPSRAPLRFIVPCKGNERILLHHQKAPCNLTHRTKLLQKNLQIDLYAQINRIRYPQLKHPTGCHSDSPWSEGANAPEDQREKGTVYIIDPCGRTSLCRCDHKGRGIKGAYASG